MRFNRLSRYPYTEYMSEKEKNLVQEHLSNNEIEYIIEYSISPREYIRYIEEKKFNIYHTTEYNALSSTHPELTVTEIVELVETSGDTFEMSQLDNLLYSYSAQTILTWIQQKDPYNKESVLIDYPINLDALVTHERTVSTFEPYHLEVLTEVPTLDNKKEIQVEKRVKEPLLALCQAIVEEKISTRVCGGLVVVNGYVSYEEQIEIFQQAKENHGQDVLFYADYPGHSEHQLGLTIDFAVAGLKSSNFDQTTQLTWLLENAHRFGFIQSYPEGKEAITGKQADNTHWRYVGIEIANYLYEHNLTLMESLGQ